MANGEHIELAKCYVTIVPTTQGAQATISKELGAATDNAAKTASQKSGGTFGQGFGKALKTTGAIATAVVGTASAAGAGLYSMAASVANLGDSIDKGSQKAGMSARSFQEWSFTLQHCGASIDTMRAGMKTLANAAQSNNKAFAELGISQEQIANMTQEELFGAVITGLQNVDDITKRTALSSKLLGRGATELGALLNMTASDTAALKQQANDLGIVMSDQTVKASAAFKDSLQNLTQSAGGAKNALVGQLLPGLTSIMDGLTGIITGTDGAKEKLQTGIQGLVSNLTSILPQALTMLQGVASGIISALPELLGGIMSALISALPSAIETLLTMAPVLIDTIGGMIGQLVNALPGLIGPILSALPGLIISVVKTILNNLPTIVSGLVSLISSICDQLPSIINELIRSLPSVIGLVVSSLIKCAPQLIKAGVTLTIAIVKALPEITLELIKAIPQVIKEIAGAIKENGPKMVSEIKSIGSRLLEGLWAGINDKFKWLTGKIKDFTKGVTDKIKGFFGIHSPSRLFKKEIGANLALGLGLGFTDEMDDVSDDMAKSIPTSLGSIQAHASGAAAYTSGTGTTNIGGNIVLNIYGAQGQDVNALANIIMQKIQTATERKAAAYA